MDDAALRHRLASLVEKTKGAENLAPAAYWVGDTAGARRILDDRDAGRLSWRSAHRAARYGLEALESGDREAAEMCLRGATDAYIVALETRVRPSDLEALNRPSERRGRKK
jgi:hypothetical protein